MSNERACQHCGVDFKPRRKSSKYCCVKCQYSASRCNFPKPCVVCGKTFSSTHRTVVCCSGRCSSIKGGQSRRKTEYKNCLMCGNVFTDTPARIASFYCSRGCCYKYKRQTGGGHYCECRGCGKRFWASLSRINYDGGGSFCSLKCTRRTGANNPLWRGGFHHSPDGSSTMLLEKHGMSPIFGHASRAVHRVMIDKYIGRPLTDNEYVVHINGDRSDNRLKNYYVYPSQSELCSARANGNYPSVSNIKWLKNQVDVLIGT